MDELPHSFVAETAFKIITLHSTSLSLPALSFTPSPLLSLSPGYKTLSMLVSDSRSLSAMNNGAS